MKIRCSFGISIGLVLLGADRWAVVLATVITAGLAGLAQGRAEKKNATTMDEDTP